MGRKNRFDFDELFDVSNQEDDGSLVAIGSKRHHMGLVCTCILQHRPDVLCLSIG